VTRVHSVSVRFRQKLSVQFRSKTDVVVLDSAESLPSVVVKFCMKFCMILKHHFWEPETDIHTNKKVR